MIIKSTTNKWKPSGALCLDQKTSVAFIDEDKDPSNQYPWHGTSCGGIIRAVKDEETCGLGIAYNCNLDCQWFKCHSSCLL